MFYEIFNSLQSNICKNLTIIWQKDQGCEEWLKILLNAEKYIKGEITQYK